MPIDVWSLYRQMLRSRLFEEAVRDLWVDGLISGEMHLGMGEEAIVAAVVSHLDEGDAMALDHRGTPPMVMRGVEMVLLLKEFLGLADGLCSGAGGHMHLFAPEYLAASSGIVGASAPTAAGFALAAQHLRPDRIAVAFFGEGAMNQGMVMESLNLAVVWKLPILFVCKDNGWAITTRSPQVTAGNVRERAASFGMQAHDVDGSDVDAVWNAAQKAIRGIRRGGGPAFLRAECSHIEGHFLGDPILKTVRRPVKESKRMVPSLIRATGATDGASMLKRVSALGAMTGNISRAAVDDHLRRRDALTRARKKLHKQEPERLRQMEKDVRAEVSAAVEAAMTASESHRTPGDTALPTP